MLTLKTKAKVIKIKRNSTSPCFNNLEIGDMIEFSVPIQRAGTAGGRTRPTYITCHNKRTNKESKVTFNQISNIVNCCVLEEIE